MHNADRFLEIWMGATLQLYGDVSNFRRGLKGDEPIGTPWTHITVVHMQGSHRPIIVVLRGVPA